MTSPKLSRRRFVGGAGVALAGLLAPPRLAAALAAAAPPTVSAFASRPDLQPPAVRVDSGSLPADRYAFVAPLAGPGQYGPLVLDGSGHPVWFHPLPTGTVATCFSPQTYRGARVLTWWEGQSVDAWGEGEHVIVDQHYREVARVRASGMQADLHELVLTPEGTALVTAYASRPADLTAFGGPAAGTAVEGVVQEIDVATGKLVFEWRSLDHVPLSESARTWPTGYDVFDYFHLNSICVDADGDLVVSARHASTIYKIDRKTGAVVWRLGGAKSDFALGPGAAFSFQHHVRTHPNGVLTVFDNASYGDQPSEPASRAIALSLDMNAHTATLLWALRDSQRGIARKMGTVQATDDGNWFVSWGDLPRFGKRAATGGTAFAASFVGSGYSYRAFTGPWQGRPTAPPDVAATSSSSSTVVHASWNGHTAVAYWRVLGGSSANALAPLWTVRRGGFDTRIDLTGQPALVAVEALDAGRAVLGRSRTVAPTAV